MVTDKDIQRIIEKLIPVLSKVFATKDDLKDFATKEDLKGFATKDDLKDFATKKELEVEISVLATKKELQFEVSLLATKDDLKELWQKIDDQLVAFRNDTMDRIDAVYKELIAKRDEQTMHTHAHMRQDEKIEGHEKRIKKLETTPITP